MNSILLILLLTVLQLVTGFGVVTLFKLSLKPCFFLPLCLLSGVAVFSVVPFLLQLLYIPLTLFSISVALLIACIVLNIRSREGVTIFVKSLRESRFVIRLYEVPFLSVIIVIACISVWRCFYLPPTPRDLTSGAEAVAQYAVQEKTMINSVFTINLESTNNQFKPPFITSLQIIYKLAGLPFGQVWLSAIFISFIVFLYHALSVTLHKVFVGMLMIAFIAIPEMYAYTFMVLFDYSNAVFFFLSIYFLIIYFDTKQLNNLAFAALLMGIATYIRSETLVLAVFAAPVFLVNGFSNKISIQKMAKGALLFLTPSVILYVLCVTIYVNHYLPIKYSIGSLINPHLLNLKPLLTRFLQVNTYLIFSTTGIAYYAYFIFFFCALLLADILITRKFNRCSRNWLFATAVIYLGLPLLGFILPLMDLDNTTKRGMFKIFPIMLLYMGNSGLLIGLSRSITAWETRVDMPEENEGDLGEENSQLE